MKVELSHEHVSSLIPWYANGTLAANERATVEEHLKTCTACAKEVEWLCHVDAAMTGLDEDAPAANHSFADVWAAVESSQKPEPVERHWFPEWLRRIWTPSAPTARLVFAAELAIILALGIFTWAVRRPSPTFTTLSGPEAPASGGVRLTVSFAPSTNVEQMNRILADVGGQIVSGPSASGIYIIQVSVPEKQDAQVQVVIDKLRASNAIRFVEREP